MFSLAAKLYLALAAFAAVCGLGYFIAVGERTGWILLLAVAVAALVGSVAGVVGGVDDRIGTLGDEPGPVDHRPVSPDAAARPSAWPLGLAAAATLVAVGAAVGAPIVILGLIAATIPLGAWFAQGWREHPTFSPRIGRRLDDRLVAPVLLPIGTLLAALFIAVALSRLLLAVDKDAAAVIGIAVAIAILGALFWISSRPNLGSSGVLAVSAIGLALLVAGGVAGAAMGEREFHPAGGEHGEAHEPVEFVAKGSKFELPKRTRLTVEPAKPVAWRFENLDAGIYHNIAVYKAEEGEGGELVQGEPIFNGKPIPDGDIEYEFEAPEEPGTYLYVCDFHVLSMRGELVVK